MKSLTASQLRVVSHPYEPCTTVKVIAGPGSGKTLTLLHKVYNLVYNGIVAPNEILILSLTNKAVDNINEKLMETFQEADHNQRWSDEERVEILEQIDVNTFHSLANKVVLENEGLVNIIEDNGWRSLMRLAGKSYRGQSRNYLTPRTFARMIQDYKEGRLQPDKIDADAILELMKTCKVVTNEDLIHLCGKFLADAEPQTSTGMTGRLLNNYKVIIIDEAQDLYPLLFPMLKLIATDKQLILFGDEHQSIYGFLGSNKHFMKQVGSMRPAEKTFTYELYDNFRSTPEIMDAAQSVIDRKALPATACADGLHNKTLSGVQPISLTLQEPLEELCFLVDQICQLVCSSAKLSDIAILTRTNEHMNNVAHGLKIFGIPVEKLTAQPQWMSDTRILFLIDIMKLLTAVFQEQGPTDQNNNLKTKTDFSVVVTLGEVRRVGPSLIHSIYNGAKVNKVSCWEFINSVEHRERLTTRRRKIVEEYLDALAPLLARSKFEGLNTPLDLVNELSQLIERLDVPLFQLKNEEQLQEFRENLLEFYQVLKLCSYSKPSDIPLMEWFVKTFLEQTVQLQKKIVSNQTDRNTIKLSTIHSSKGLEFPIVFLLGQLDKHLWGDNNTLYVGMTRARNLLYMTNINHSKLKALNSIEHPYMIDNAFFWNYYNNDLGRPYKPNLASSTKNYKHLLDKYRIPTFHKRSFVTHCLPILRLGRRILTN
ncbi:AaceriADR113Wp [[Ashbya] aceris (nom. inval.)]|nr:AaceriADR113Wp [[Ashbya] aceris (nom. inval.)]